MSTAKPKQNRLPFDGKQETDRQERVRRLLSGDKRITTAARLFDENAHCEATRIAEGHNHE